MKTHCRSVAALLLALLTGCASSGGLKQSAMLTPTVKLPPLGRVALAPSSYPHRVVVHGQSKGKTFRAAMEDGAPMVKGIGGAFAESNSGGAEVFFLITPVVVGTAVRAATLGAFTGMTGAEQRAAQDFSARLVEIRHLPMDMATALRAESFAGDWLMSDGLTRGATPKAGERAFSESKSDDWETELRTASRAAGADTLVQLEVLSLRLEPQAGSWRLRGLAIARFTRLTDSKRLHTFTVGYLTPEKESRPLRDWAAANSPLLERELKRAAENMAADFGRQMLAAMSKQ